MAANSKTTSLERCLTSLENTLKSKTTGRPKFKTFIKDNSEDLYDDHMLKFDFLVDCLDILSDDTSAEDKFAKAKKLADVANKDPPKIITNTELVEKLQPPDPELEVSPDNVAQLESAVKELFALNVRSTLSAVFDDFVKDEREKKKALCGGISNPKKKSRTCETL